MRGQKEFGLKQGGQGRQSGLRSKISLSRCLLFKPPPPILLPLPADPHKPLVMSDLPEETQKNRKPHHLETAIIKMGPQGMDCPTLRTPIPLEQQRFFKAIKEPAHITMTPQSCTPAPRTPCRTRPRIVLAHLLQKLDIKIAIQYQVRSLWGITENMTPARERTLGYPFSFPSAYSEKKKDLYNKR